MTRPLEAQRCEIRTLNKEAETHLVLCSTPTIISPAPNLFCTQGYLRQQRLPISERFLCPVDSEHEVSVIYVFLILPLAIHITATRIRFYIQPTKYPIL